MSKPNLESQSQQPLQIDNIKVGTLQQFLAAIKEMPDKDIATKLTASQWESWDIIQRRGVSSRVMELKTKAVAGTLSGLALKRDLLGILLGSDLIRDQLVAIRRAAGWRFWFRVVLALALFLASAVWGIWPFSIAAVLIVSIVASGYLLGALQIFTIERKISKSGFDGLKFAVDILVGISSAMLALIAGRGMLVSLAAASLGVSVFVGIISAFNIAVSVGKEEENYVSINSATWDWIETLITLQFVFFVLGSVSLVYNVMYN
jgi:hypothetical protein